MIAYKYNFFEEKMDIDNQGHVDPQFKKVLQTCLKMEIAEVKKKLNDNTRNMEQLKIMIRAELDKRKLLKAKVTQVEKISTILNETATKLNVNVNETLEMLEMMKANIDDRYKLNQIETQVYQNIIEEYKETWQTYRARYEEAPLAKARSAVKIKLQKLKIEYMVMIYKKTELMRIIKQKQHIDWIRTRVKIIEFATMMVEQSKIEIMLTKLKVNVDYHTRELQSTEMELQTLRKEEEDQKKLRKQKVLDMGPPKIDHLPYREMYSSNQMRPKIQHQWTRKTFDDNISVNTLVLEELCIKESTSESPEIDVETIYDNDDFYVQFKRTASQKVGKPSNLKNTIVTEKMETNAALVAPDAEAKIKEADNDVIMKTDNDINMKEIYRAETQKLQEPVETQANCSANKNLFKHSMAKIPNEVPAKRMRLERKLSKGSSIITTASHNQPLNIVKEVNVSKPSPSIPKIVSIESVHYNIAPISAPKVVRPQSILSSSMFSPMHFECCDSMSSFNQDLMSKAPSSYEGSLCNYKLSPNSDISTDIYSKDVQMATPSKNTVQQNKNQSDEKISSFPLNNFQKLTESNFSLF